MAKTFLLLLFFPFLVYSQEKQLQVFFDFDISEASQTSAQKLNDWIQENQSAEISKIYGYCDSKGSFEYNDTLSLKRAKHILQVLQEKSISIKDNIEIKGFGERHIASKIDSENRKAVIFYTIPKKIISIEKKLESLTEDIKTIKVGDKLRLKNLNFYNRSGRVVESSIPILDELLKVMQDNPKLRIQIQGHICCQLGTDQENIGGIRARAVYDFLVSNEIDRSRLSYKSFGSSVPLYPIPEKSEWEKDQNRRVEILILQN